MNEDINKFLYHITWATHNSRVSERMIKYSANKGLKPLVMDDELEVEITSYIAGIVKEDCLKILEYNICADHVHMVLYCDEKKRDNIVRKLKGKSTQLYKDARNINSPVSLWAQKYNFSTILNDEQLSNTYEYVRNNRIKHKLSENKRLKSIISQMITPYENLFD